MSKCLSINQGTAGCSEPGIVSAWFKIIHNFLNPLNRNWYQGAQDSHFVTDQIVMAAHGVPWLNAEIVYMYYYGSNMHIIIKIWHGIYRKET